MSERRPSRAAEVALRQLAAPIEVRIFASGVVADWDERLKHLAELAEPERWTFGTQRLGPTGRLDAPFEVA